MAQIIQTDGNAKCYPWVSTDIAKSLSKPTVSSEYTRNQIDMIPISHIDLNWSKEDQGQTPVGLLFHFKFNILLLITMFVVIMIGTVALNWQNILMLHSSVHIWGISPPFMAVSKMSEPNL